MRSGLARRGGHGLDDFIHQGPTASVVLSCPPLAAFLSAFQNPRAAAHNRIDRQGHLWMSLSVV
jgi:hypothetical protein